MTWTAVFCLFAGLAAGIYAAMWICTLPQIRAAAGGRRPFDVRLGYTPTEARAFLSALTPEGRALYLGPQRTLDGIFLIVWTVALAMASILALGPPLSLLVAGAAILAGVFDAVENVRVAGLLRKAPDQISEAEIRSASRATTTKFALTGAAAAAVVLGWLLG